MSAYVSDKHYPNKSYHCTELLTRDNDFTPDYLDRKLEKYIPVFVYGTLKVGGRFHEILKDAPCFGDGYTATPTYTMKGTGNDFPVIFSHGKASPENAAVFGEVYIINARLLLELDRIEGNGEMYQREQRWIFLLDQSIKGKGGMIRPGLKAWVYIGKPEFWEGIPLTPIKPKKMGVVDIWDWPIHSSIPKTAQTYPPRPSNPKPAKVTPSAMYQSTPESSAWMWDGFFQDDDKETQEEIDWADYDAAMTGRAERMVPWDE